MELKRKRGRFMDDDDSEFLPPEINTEILSRLPGDSAIGCRRISKPWRSLIDDPSFVDAHTRQVISSSSSNPKQFGNYLIPSSSTSSSGFFLCAKQADRNFKLQFVEYNDDDHVEGGEKLVSELKPITVHPFPFYLGNWGILVMSSCHGLVFMGSTKPNSNNDMFVCNPFTREYLNLRKKSTMEERRCHLKSKGHMAYGFGYLPFTNEYKIVNIYYPELNGGKGKVSVYTLGSGRWRNKGETPYSVYTEYHTGFFANGAIHWFTNMMKIVSFDLADEKFRVVVPLPPPPPSANHVDQLGVLGGCLCVTRSDKTRCECPKDIWVLNVNITKEEGKKKFLWKKRFRIPWKATTKEAEPHVILNSGKVLLRGRAGLICYDPKTGAFSEGDGSIYFNHNLKVIPYAKSFVSLKALGEEDAKCFGGFVSHALAEHHHHQQQGGCSGVDGRSKPDHSSSQVCP